MEIAKGEYEIPLGCRALVHGGKVYVVEKLSLGRLKGNRRHCKDCKHRVVGVSTLGNRKTTYICELRNKTTIKGDKLHYAAAAYGEICNNFKEK